MMVQKSITGPVFIHILNQSSVAMRLLKTVESLEPLLVRRKRIDFVGYRCVL